MAEGIAGLWLPRRPSGLLPPVPASPALAKLRAALPKCRACDLWEESTQPVLGEGPPGARLMLIGEEPGDREDIEGKPFVRPARSGLSRPQKPIESDQAELVTVTAHPSSILRPRSAGERERAMDEFVSDLARVVAWLTQHA